MKYDLETLAYDIKDGEFYFTEANTKSAVADILTLSYDEQNEAFKLVADNFWNENTDNAQKWMAYFLVSTGTSMQIMNFVKNLKERMDYNSDKSHAMSLTQQLLAWIMFYCMDKNLNFVLLHQ